MGIPYGHKIHLWLQRGVAHPAAVTHGAPQVILPPAEQSKSPWSRFYSNHVFPRSLHSFLRTTFRESLLLFLCSVAHFSPFAVTSPFTPGRCLSLQELRPDHAGHDLQPCHLAGKSLPHPRMGCPKSQSLMDWPFHLRIPVLTCRQKSSQLEVEEGIADWYRFI